MTAAITNYYTHKLVPGEKPDPIRWRSSDRKKNFCGKIALSSQAIRYDTIR